MSGQRDPLFENKLIATLLVAALIVFGAPLLIDRIALGNRGLQRPVLEERTVSSDSDDPFPAAYENSDAQRGMRQSAICRSCHTFERFGDDLIGPNLWGVVGRSIAAREAFVYSPALRAVEGEWTPGSLNQFLTDTQAFAPGSSMYFQSSDEQERADIIKFLSTLSDQNVY